MAKDTTTSLKRSREEDLERKERKEAKRQRKEEKRRRKEEKSKQSESTSEKLEDSAGKKRRKEEKKARKLSKESAHQSKSSTSTARPSAVPTNAPASSPPRPNLAASLPKASPSLPWAAPSFFSGAPSLPAKVSSGFNPSDFPPGFDFSALTAHLSPGEPSGSSQSAASGGVGAGPSSQSRDAAIARLTELTAAPGFTDTVVRAPRRGVTAADLDRVLLTAGTARSGGSFGRASAARNKENIGNSKEATIADAQGLTEREILSQKLYQPHQVKWLEEAGILTKVYRGKFSAKEIDTITETLRRWCGRNGLSFEEGKALLNERNGAQVELYANLTTELAASLEGRPLRNVRRLAKEIFHPDHNKGAWTEEELAQLATAYETLGPKWKLIGEKLGRLPRDVRCRYRDYGLSTHRGGKWTAEEEAALEAAVNEQCQVLGLDPTDKGLPWKAIAAKISKSTAPNACLLKWGQIVGKRRRAEESTTRSKLERTRDDEKLVKLLLQQTSALERDSEEAIDWNEVSKDFLFDRFRASKAWKRLVKKDLPPDKESATLREKLDVLLGIIEAQLKRYNDKEAARKDKAEARAKQRAEKPPREKSSSSKKRKVEGAGAGGQAGEVDLADQIGSDDEL